MLRIIPSYKDEIAHTVITFTPYSLSVLLNLNARGFKHIGLTTNVFNGLHLTSKDMAKNEYIR